MLYSSVTAKDILPGRIFGSEEKANTPLKDIIQYIPDIRYFIENGDKCASRCGVECDYCKKCIEKLNQILA